MKLQQYSGPVMAKGLEDTAFYRYNRFVALNEVGGNPDQFGVSLAAFHQANAQRAERWPHAMLATSTHDTKRGEDTRARLAVLSEMPRGMGAAGADLEPHLARRGAATSKAPRRPTATTSTCSTSCCVGAWPVELLGADRPMRTASNAYAERIEGAMVKSMREAKVHSTWAAPNTAYEEAMLGLRRDALDPSRAGRVSRELSCPSQSASPGWASRNSLVQTVLKLTLPGVPDIYQGTELWDLSLVDPDNRRPVDYALRQRRLEEIWRRPPTTGRAPWRAICNPGRMRDLSSPPWRPSSAFAARRLSSSPRAITRGFQRRATGRTRSAPSRAGTGMRPCWWRWRAFRGGGKSEAPRRPRRWRRLSRSRAGSGANS